MARSQRKKPLMIRGDRLFFAMRILETLDDLRDYRPRIARKHRLRTTQQRVRNTLQERYGEDVSMLKSTIGSQPGCGDGVFSDSVLAFFDANASHVRGWKVNAESFIASANRGIWGQKESALLRRFLRAIASGELTEENFRA